MKIRFNAIMAVVALPAMAAFGQAGTTFGVLHQFNALPAFSQPTRAVDGTLYVTSATGNGSVCKLGTGGNLITLYNFTGGADGAVPQAGLLLSGRGIRHLSRT